MNILISILAIVSVLSFTASIYTLSKLFNALVEIESFKKSTHTVQFVGASKKDVEVSDEIEKYNKEYLEEAQEKFPNFATFEDDLELKGL